MNQTGNSQDLEQQIVDRLNKEYVLVPRVKAAFFAGVAVALMGGTGGVSYGVAKSVINSSAAYIAQKEIESKAKTADKVFEVMSHKSSELQAESERLVGALENKEQDSVELLARMRARLAGSVLGRSESVLDDSAFPAENEPVKILEVEVDLNAGQNVLLLGQIALTVNGEATKTRVWLARNGRRISPLESYFAHKHGYVHTPAFVDYAEHAGPATYALWAAKGDGGGKVRVKKEGAALQVTALN